MDAFYIKSSISELANCENKSGKEYSKYMCFLLVDPLKSLYDIYRRENKNVTGKVQCFVLSL